MQGERGSVFKSFFLNPLVWISAVLTGFTMYYEGEHGAFLLFYKAETYRNLAIGAAIYVGLFDRRYTAGRCRLDLAETLFAVLETMGYILLFWMLFLFLAVNYRLGGAWYSQTLTTRYERHGIKSGEKIPDSVKNVLPSVQPESGKRYKVTPNADGSFTIEVLED